jgi:thiol-disulfide isomerase/thioredoxin
MGEPVNVISEEGAHIPVYNFDGFKGLLTVRNDTTYLINFWATWCKPCVAEIPHFVEVMEDLQDEKVRFVFVSLDDDSQYTAMVKLARKLGIEQNTIVLNEVDYNSWISKVDPNWSGAIPATIISNAKFRRFHEGPLKKNQLKEKFEQALKSIQ